MAKNNIGVPNPKKNIVVLGAGFGGLKTAMIVADHLRQLNALEKYKVVLIDRNDCHLYTPLLYKLAAASEKAPVCTYDTSSLIKNHVISFIQGEVSGMDLPTGEIHLKSGVHIRAEYVVLALGSETNYFGIPGLKENALQLKQAEHALMIRESLNKIFALNRPVTIVIGGAGANGIELAAEIKQWADMEELMANHAGLKVRVVLVEGMPTVLPGLDAHIVTSSMRRIQALGVEVMTGAKILSVAKDMITIDGGATLPYDMLVWTGGIKTPDLITALPLQKDSRGSKPLANDSMNCMPAPPDAKFYSTVYGLGDSITFMNTASGRPVPAVARAAILQADVVAQNILQDIQQAENPDHASLHTTFKASDYPYVIPIGENWAVAKIGSFVFEGYPAWIFGKLVEIHYLTSIMSLPAALNAWRKMK